MIVIGFPYYLLAPTRDVPLAKYAARRVLATFVFAQSNIPRSQPAANQPITKNYQHSLVSQ